MAKKKSIIEEAKELVEEAVEKVEDAVEETPVEEVAVEDHDSVLSKTRRELEELDDLDV